MFVTSVMKISQRISELFGGPDFYTKIYKGALIHKNVGGGTFFVLCTSSDDALLVNQVK